MSQEHKPNHSPTTPKSPGATIEGKHHAKASAHAAKASHHAKSAAHVTKVSHLVKDDNAKVSAHAAKETAKAAHHAKPVTHAANATHRLKYGNAKSTAEVAQADKADDHAKDHNVAVAEPVTATDEEPVQSSEEQAHSHEVSETSSDEDDESSEGEDESPVEQVWTIKNLIGPKTKGGRIKKRGVVKKKVVLPRLLRELQCSFAGDLYWGMTGRRTTRRSR